MDRFWERPYGLKFATGIEDTFVPQVSPGRRALDEYELTGHYQRWREDLDLAAYTGAEMIRYGIPWYRVNPSPHSWDWSWTDRVFDHLLCVGLTPIVDLMHYGCPLWMEREFANPDYPRHVAEYAARFAERHGEAVRFYTPMNEPLLNAVYCGEIGRWPPALTGDGGGFVNLLRQLVSGIVQTQRAIRDLVQDPVFIHVEAPFRYVGGPEQAERLRFLEQRSWLVYDLLFGRVGESHSLYRYLSENGLPDEDLARFREYPAEPDVLGINYYPHLTTTKLVPGGRERKVWSGTEGLEDVVRGFHARYEKPIFLTETSVAGGIEERLRWLRDSLEKVHALRSEGVPLVGFTWWPLFSLVDWDYREGRGQVEEYLRHMGMYDLVPDLEGGFLRAETPVVQAFHAATRKVKGGAKR